VGDGRPVVLIAEDYADFRARLLLLVEPLALTCIPVSTGGKAIDVLRDPAQDLHLLVTDLE